MSNPTSDYLNQPTLPVERRALRFAIGALTEIANETTAMGPEKAAEAALELLRGLVPELTGEVR